MIFFLHFLPAKELEVVMVMMMMHFNKQPKIMKLDETAHSEKMHTSFGI